MSAEAERLNKLTEQIIGAAIEVHRHLGAGKLESAYEACLCHELFARSLAVERQVAMPLRYKDVILDVGYRLDLVIEKTVAVELKSVAQLDRVHDSQLLSYLRLSGLPVGLLINFNVARLVDGLRRFAGRQTQ